MVEAGQHCSKHSAKFNTSISPNTRIHKSGSNNSSGSKSPARWIEHPRCVGRLPRMFQSCETRTTSRQSSITSMPCRICAKTCAPTNAPSSFQLCYNIVLWQQHTLLLYYRQHMTASYLEGFPLACLKGRQGHSFAEQEYTNANE